MQQKPRRCSCPGALHGLEEFKILFQPFLLRSKLDRLLYGADHILDLSEMRAGERKTGVRQTAPGICSRLKRVQLAISRESVYNKKDEE